MVENVADVFDDGSALPQRWPDHILAGGLYRLKT